MRLMTISFFLVTGLAAPANASEGNFTLLCESKVLIQSHISDRDRSDYAKDRARWYAKVFSFLGSSNEVYVWQKFRKIHHPYTDFKKGIEWGSYSKIGTKKYILSFSGEEKYVAKRYVIDRTTGFVEGTDRDQKCKKIKYIDPPRSNRF